MSICIESIEIQKQDIYELVCILYKHIEVTTSNKCKENSQQHLFLMKHLTEGNLQYLEHSHQGAECCL